MSLRALCEDCRQPRPIYLHRLRTPELERTDWKGRKTFTPVRALCRACAAGRQVRTLAKATGAA